jgi:hypothetical protein
MPFFTRHYRLCWPSTERSLHAVALQIHERVRASVLARVQSGQEVHFVSGGVALPPGPTRLVLEDRRRGLPGRRFSATLRRNSADLELSIETSRLRPVPLDLLEPLLIAVREMVPGATVEWIKE